ncbi:SDR family oxidoreductase [bacterium]|nr:SDR family oxidoreductase [bacterium]
MSFLNLENKTFVVTGVANKKSVAYHVAMKLESEGAKVVYVVRSEARKEKLSRILVDRPIYICDVEFEEQINKTCLEIVKAYPNIDGMLHSIAFANFEEGMKPFHETSRKNFLQTMDISCYSLVALSNAMKEAFTEHASVVTVSISTTEMTAESYGWMAPAKAALNSSVCFLAKSFSRFSKVRFNALCPGLLKTSASAGIPGYMDNYLFAEKCTLRGEALKTEEVANAALFLLSDASSAINAQQMVLDAGMRLNYFDQDIVKPVVKALL